MLKDRGSEKLMKSRMAVNHRESTTKLLCIGTSRGKEYPNICMVKIINSTISY